MTTLLLLLMANIVTQKNIRRASRNRIAVSLRARRLAKSEKRAAESSVRVQVADVFLVGRIQWRKHVVLHHLRAAAKRGRDVGGVGWGRGG